MTDLLDSVLDQVRQSVARGSSLEDTRKEVNVATFRTRFTGGDPFMIRMFDQVFTASAIDRAYAEATERAKRSTQLPERFADLVPPNGGPPIEPVLRPLRCAPVRPRDYYLASSYR